MTEQTTLITSVKLPVEREKFLFIGLDGALCGAGEKSLGVLNADTSANEYGPVCVSGIAIILSNAAITQGAKVQSDANGKAITLTGSNSLNGYALDSSTGANQKIRILLT